MKHMKRLAASAALLILLSGCATAPINGACEFYRAQRALMPEPSGSAQFLGWVNEVDAGMLAACM